MKKRLSEYDLSLANISEASRRVEQASLLRRMSGALRRAQASDILPPDCAKEA